jgi:hypothetical protein
MFRQALALTALLAIGSACASEAASKPEKDTSPGAQNSEPPAPVDKKLLEFLQTKINLKVSGMSPQLALAWQLKLADIPLTPRASKTVAEKKVDFELADVTLAEALRTVNTKTGCQYRIVKNEIRMAMPEEWKEIDAGKTTFEKIVPEEKSEAAAKK